MADERDAITPLAPTPNGHRAFRAVSPQVALRRAPLNEIGVSGLKQQQGQIYEEPLRELRGNRWKNTVVDMTYNDPVIGATLFAIEMLCRQVKWFVRPGTQDAEGVKWATYVYQCFKDMSISWPDLLSEILSFLPWGWSYLELVYKLRQGPNSQPSKRSEYNDGLLGWRKWSIRAQETLDRWDFDESGGVQGMVQHDPYTFREHFIPIEKALLFRAGSRKSSPEGKSVLRTAYTSWFYKTHLQRIEAIGVERDLAGIPVAWVPHELLDADASPKDKAALQNFLDLVQRIHNDEQTGVVMPQEYDEKGHKLYDLTLLGSAGQRQFDTDKIIMRHDQRMAMSVLADFILLGHERVGSFALSADKTDMFTIAVSAWLWNIAGVVNRHAIPRLLAYNGVKVQNYPLLVPSDINPIPLDDVVGAWKDLTVAGVDLGADPRTVAYLRGIMNLPALSQPLPEEQGAVPNLVL